MRFTYPLSSDRLAAIRIDRIRFSHLLVGIFRLLAQCEIKRAAQPAEILTIRSFAWMIDFKAFSSGGLS